MKDNQRIPTIIIGPTASGKSDLAIDIAHKDNGVVINADSIQSYKEIKILSARPDESQIKKAPHALYGFLDSCEQLDAFLWSKLAKKEIYNAEEMQKLPIIVGGTGFYISALIDGLSPIPPISNEIREFVNKTKKDSNDFFLWASLIDPLIKERINHKDIKRIERAVQVKLQTKQSIFFWHKQPKIPLLDKFKIIVIMPKEREELYSRINSRFLTMIENGAINEAQKIINTKKDSIIWNCIGLKEIRDYLIDEISLDEAIKISQQKTRNYAKRQITWIKNQIINKHDFSIKYFF